jgi:glycosyltransferase involved in cell wall biosynthesis
MRVLYLVPQPKQPDRLSAYTFLDEEIRGLAAAGVEPYVLSTRAARDTAAGPVKVRAMPPSAGDVVQNLRFLLGSRSIVPPANLRRPRDLYRSLAIERSAAEIVETERIDVIHSHFGWPGSFGGVLARAATGRPLIASLRGADVLVDADAGYGRRSHPYHDRTIRRLLATADRTLYFSDFMRETGVSLGAPASRAHVVRKGVDLTQFTPLQATRDRAALKRRLVLPDRPMILTVAGLIRRKGIHHLLEAAARLRQTHDFSVVICGEGVERERLEGLSETLGLRDRTCFRGSVDRQAISHYFAACDVFVLASTLEAAGNVLLEAMAAARPVVCTASGGPTEYVRDGETGFVVPVGDVPALAARLRLLLDDPALAYRFGEQGLRLAQDGYGFDRMTGDIVRLYHDLLAERWGHERPTGAKRVDRRGCDCDDELTDGVAASGSTPPRRAWPSTPT